MMAPLTRGLVVFVPAQGRASTGSLDEQGRYVLTCFDGQDGAVPGRYRVEVAPDGVPLEGEPTWVVPARYSRCDTSELEVDITGPTSAAGRPRRLRNSQGSSASDAPANAGHRRAAKSVAPNRRKVQLVSSR